MLRGLHDMDSDKLFTVCVILVIGILSTTIATIVSIDRHYTHLERLNYVQTGTCAHSWKTHSSYERRCETCGTILYWDSEKGRWYVVTTSSKEAK